MALGASNRGKVIPEIGEGELHVEPLNSETDPSLSAVMQKFAFAHETNATPSPFVSKITGVDQLTFDVVDAATTEVIGRKASTPTIRPRMSRFIKCRR
jgi:hypothetical protein